MELVLIGFLEDVHLGYEYWILSSKEFSMQLFLRQEEPW